MFKLQEVFPLLNCIVASKTKAPGLDGIQVDAIRTFMEMMFPDLFNIFREFHRNGQLPSCAHLSLVPLIPQATDADHISCYRPISFSEILRRVVAKILASRQKPVYRARVRVPSCIYSSPFDSGWFCHCLWNGLGPSCWDLIYIKAGFSFSHGLIYFRAIWG